MPRPCVFFDRDGIVNASPGPAAYVETPDAFHLLPAFVDALRVVTGRGWAAVVVTNQRGVHLGRMTEDDLGAIHLKLIDQLDQEGLGLDGIYACTAGDNAHPDRKPNPGLLLRAARDLGLDLPRSWMIGDSERDIEAGQRAGCAVTVRVAPEGTSTAATWRVDGMEAVPGLLDRELGPG